MALDFGIPAKMTAHRAIMRIAGKSWPFASLPIFLYGNIQLAISC
jgi:hypothetical protein